jgi:hypothetical protein
MPVPRMGPLQMPRAGPKQAAIFLMCFLPLPGRHGVATQPHSARFISITVPWMPPPANAARGAQMVCKVVVCASPRWGLDWGLDRSPRQTQGTCMMPLTGSPSDRVHLV